MQVDCKSKTFSRSSKFAEFYQKKSAFFSESRKNKLTTSRSTSSRSILVPESTSTRVLSTVTPQTVTRNECEGRQEINTINRQDSERSLRVLVVDDDNNPRHGSSASLISDAAVYKPKYSSTLRKVHLEQMFREKQNQLRQKRQKELLQENRIINATTNAPVREEKFLGAEMHGFKSPSHHHQAVIYDQHVIHSFGNTPHVVSSVHTNDLEETSKIIPKSFSSTDQSTGFHHEDDNKAKSIVSDAMSMLSCSLPSSSLFNGSKSDDDDDEVKEDELDSMNGSNISNTYANNSYEAHSYEAQSASVSKNNSFPAQRRINDTDRPILNVTYASSLSSETDISERILKSVASDEKKLGPNRRRSLIQMPEKNFFFESLRKVLDMFDDSPSGVNANPPLDTVVIGSSSESSEFSAVSYHSY